jgi:hypothetical protein
VTNADPAEGMPATEPLATVPPDAVPPDAGLPAGPIEAADAAARTFIGPETPGVAIGIAVGGTTWADGWGLADAATARAAGPATRFRIASITKTLTATLILQLRDEGRLGLDDPLVAHLPEATRIGEIAGRHAQVTIGRLLAHTAGLPLGAPAGDPRRTEEPRPDAILARLHEVAIVRPPGDRWAYSNLGYELLAIVAERVTGEAYASRLERTVLRPAGMTGTSYTPGPDDAVGRLEPVAGEPPRPAPPHDELAHRGDGGLWASAADLASWLAVQRHVGDDDRRGDRERVLDGGTLRSMHRPLAFVDDAWTLAQGLGWAMERFDGETWVRHTGSMRGFRSIALVRPADAIGVAVLANGTVRPNELARTIARSLLAAHRSGELPTRSAVRDAEEDPAGPHAALAGRWSDATYGMRVTTRATATGLLLQEAVDGPWRPLEPVALPERWRIGGDDERTGEPVRFPADADGSVRVVNVAGYALAREVSAG